MHCSSCPWLLAALLITVGIKLALDGHPSGHKIVLDLKETLLLVHSVLSSLETFRRDLSNAGGEVNFTPLESMMSISAAPSPAAAFELPESHD